MPVFPSRSWMEAFCVELSGHPRGGDVATALDGVYRFTIEPAGPLRERYSYDVEIRPDSNGGAAARLLAEDVSPRLQLTADYQRWRQLILGELDIGLAVMLRRVRVSGDLSGLISRLGDTQPLLESLHRVDSQWLDG